MAYRLKKQAFVLLADGTQFFGKSIGIDGDAFGEICFNTGMTGYQEIFTDPSYFGQIMVTTNTHIGNYGIEKTESQSKEISIAGLICKDFSFNYSRPCGTESLFDYLRNHKLVTICDVDTRAVVNYIRENGAMNAVVSTNIGMEEKLLKEQEEFPTLISGLLTVLNDNVAVTEVKLGDLTSISNFSPDWVSTILQLYEMFED